MTWRRVWALLCLPPTPQPRSHLLRLPGLSWKTWIPCEGVTESRQEPGRGHTKRQGDGMQLQTGLLAKRGFRWDPGNCDAVTIKPPEELSSLSGQLGAGTQDNVHDLVCICLLVGVLRVRRWAQLSGGTSGCPGNSPLEGNGWQPLDLGAAQSSQGSQGESPRPRVWTSELQIQIFVNLLYGFGGASSQLGKNREWREG